MGNPVRHAQYRQELADTLQAATVRPVAVERRDPSATKPAITVFWTGSTVTRAVGWTHGFAAEIVAAEPGPYLDDLVATVAETVRVWQPNTSRVTASAPTVTVGETVDADVSYPTVIVSTTVTEPAT